jgi:hypothetical protein
MKSKAGFRKYGKAIVAIAVIDMQNTALNSEDLYCFTCSLQTLATNPDLIEIFR